jgi:hypothetical protein
MPTIDGGHYFITALIPVRHDTDPGSGKSVAHSHALRETLATLPTAQQSPVCAQSHLNSPFARCTRTHFARFAVIDQPMFNGRDRQDALYTAARDIDPTVQQEFDTLKRPWLLFVADFDVVPQEADGGLKSWLTGLWTKAEPEMRAVFEHCYGFNERVVDANGFAEYVAKCRIDTTMSYNEYWPGRPPLTGWSISGALAWVGIGAVAGLACAWLAVWPWWGWVLAAVAGVAIAAVLAAWRINHAGAQPFPMAPDSDLPGVLKALYLQQQFCLFVEKHQGADAQALHVAFGLFCASNQLNAKLNPTQPPGVIRSDGLQTLTPARAPGGSSA